MKSNNRHIFIFFAIIGLLFPFQSCVYKFNPGTTGGAKTLLIRNFQDFSALSPPYTRQVLTEKLKSYFQQNSSLSIVNQTSDWELSGAVTSYVVTPIAAQENQRAGGNRLTISVKVNFINNLEPKKNYEQIFPFYADFAAGASLTQVESGLINTILDQIVFDIYTRTTSDW